MEWSKRKKALWRIPCLVVVIFALFWGIWFAIAGSVPDDGAGISRWWDIPGAGFIAFMMLVSITSTRDHETAGGVCIATMFGSFFCAAIVGFFCGMFTGAILGLGITLVCASLIGLYTLICRLFRYRFWRGFGRWLTGDR